ncbi:MAG: transposase [Hydrogenophaga sp.]|nr:transposase [Hydrogenophaga sp.]MDO9434895.1 transposase [Hydrogenophaga sp.]
MPAGSASANSLDYSLRRWEVLIRFVDDGQLPVDNNCSRTRSGRGSGQPSHLECALGA